MTIRQLVPLRVPTRWAMLFNSFAEVDFDTASDEERDSYFSQDLLKLCELQLRDDIWECPGDSIVIVLGWYEDEVSASGAYRLRVVRGNIGGEPLAVFVHRDRHTVATALEGSMELLGAGVSSTALQKLFDRLIP